MAKILLFAALIISALSSAPVQTQYTMGPEDALDFVSGLLKGFDIDLTIGDINSCISDVKELAADITTAIDDFKKADIADIEAGVQEIVAAGKLVSQAVKDCSDVTDKVEELDAILDALANPASFEYVNMESLVINGKEVLLELNALIISFVQEKYEKTGYIFGMILKKFADEEIDSEALIQGVLDGLDLDVKLEDILKCIKSVEKIAGKLGKIIKVVKSGNIAKILKHIGDLTSILKSFPGIIKECTSFSHDELLPALNRLYQPVTVEFVADKSLVIEKIEVFADLEAMTSDFSAGKFHEAGADVGKMVKKFVQQSA